MILSTVQMGASLGQADAVPIASQARFQALVQPHLARLLRFAGRRLRNPADAEDVVQEACTRAWVAFDDLREDALVLPWLYRILRSSLSDHFEKQTRREQLAPTLTWNRRTTPRKIRGPDRSRISSPPHPRSGSTNSYGCCRRSSPWLSNYMT